MVTQIEPREEITNGHQTTARSARQHGSPATQTRADEVVVEKPLTPTEMKELAKYESAIKRGLKSFLEVGEALLGIRDHRLYRGSHSAFEAYCREKWFFSKTHANRLISSASVAKDLAPLGVTPKSEGQVRLLASLDSPARKKVWKQAEKAAGGKSENVTAKLIVNAARMLGVKTSSSTSSASSQTRRSHAPGDTVPRTEVIDALKTWARENWKDFGGTDRKSTKEFIESISAAIKDI